MNTQKNKGETQERRSCGNGGKDWGDPAANQGMPRTVGTSQKLGEKHEQVLPQASRGNQLCGHLGFIFLTSRTVSEYLPVVLSYSVCGYSLQKP